MRPISRQKSIIIRTSLLFIMATCLAGGYLMFYHGQTPDTRHAGFRIYQSDLTKKTLEQAITRSAMYLARQCDPTGKFVYRINLDPAVKVRPKYNVLRHAGTVYALAVYADTHRDKVVRDALERSARFLVEKTIRPIPENPGVLAVWSPAKMCGRKGSDKVKLGGTGLGLVALIEAQKTIPDIISTKDLARLGRFILFMQKDDGSFYSRYIPDRGGRDDSWTSLYYPGEAALGLLMLYEKDPSSTWLQSASSAMAYLARARDAKVIVDADHWSLIASAKLLNHYDRSGLPASKPTIVQHGLKICRSILTGIIRYGEDSPRYGALTKCGFTTRTAIRIEGLLAASDFIFENDALLNAQVTSAVRQGLIFLLRAQIQTGKHAGGIPRVPQTLAFSKLKTTGGRGGRDCEIRIDYVQHALCAMMQYSEKYL